MVTHLGRLDLPITLVVLDDTKGIDPDILGVELAGYFDCVLECFGQRPLCDVCFHLEKG